MWLKGRNKMTEGGTVLNFKKIVPFKMHLYVKTVNTHH
jgi:hypothetical protein